MMKNDFNENEAIRYFFGELSETEQTAMEEKFFADEEFSLFLDEVETDLIDSYIRDELEFSQKRKFEEKFLVSEHRQSRVKAALVLLEKEKLLQPVAVTEDVKPTFLESLKRFFSVPNLAYASFAVIFLALIGGFVWFLQRPTEIVKIGNENIRTTPSIQSSPQISPTVALTTSPTPTNVNSLPIEPEKSPTPIEKKGEPKNEPQPQPQPQPRQVSPVMARLDLFSSDSRSGGNEANKISLKPETGSIFLRLRFNTEEEFTKFRIEMRDAGGNLISSRNAQNKNSLNLTIPAKNLRKGIYKITLKGAKTDLDFEDLDFFDLIVEKK